MLAVFSGCSAVQNKFTFSSIFFFIHPRPFHPFFIFRSFLGFFPFLIASFLSETRIITSLTMAKIEKDDHPVLLLQVPLTPHRPSLLVRMRKWATKKLIPSCCASREEDGEIYHLSPTKATVTESGSARLFGTSLEVLVATASGKSIEPQCPPVVERLFSTVELIGIDVEGVYRKSGVLSRVQNLKKSLEEETDEEQVDLKEQPVHVLAAVVKSFLRELPEPLLTFERYEQFLKAAGIVDGQERASSLMALVLGLPASHYALLQRLLFHLAQVAGKEEANRMSANALAIVFAPCILRTDKPQDGKDSLDDVASQVTAVQVLIEETIVAASKPAADEIPATPQTSITLLDSDSSDLPGDDEDMVDFPSSSNCDVMPSVADICEMEFESNSTDMNTNEQVNPTPDEINHGGKAGKS